jgi:hypothetical protein
MKTTRAVRLAAPLALALCLAAPEANAQFGNSGDLAILAVLIAPPALASLIFDVVNLGTLANGHAFRGPAISGTVFGGVTTLLSFLALAAGVTSSSAYEYFIPLGATGVALGLSSVLLGVYAITRPPPPSSPRSHIESGGPVDHQVPGTRASGDVIFAPSVYAVKGGLGAAAMLNVAL